MSQRSIQKAESRAAILKSAAALVRERGLARTTVGDATAGAGLTVGAFYAHFSDKDDLLASAFEEAFRDTEALVANAAAGKKASAAVAAVVCRYLSEEHLDDIRGGCPLPAVLGEAAATDMTASRAPLARSIETMQARLVAVAPGAVSADRALALVALMVGGQILARAARGTPVSSRVLGACRAAGTDLVRRPARRIAASKP
jgi:TetR/AcrR family transcriptional repressor of nem operon